MRAICKLIGFALAVWAGAKIFTTGIQDVLDGIKANPSDAEGVAWGIAQLLLAILVFFIIWAVSVGIVNSVSGPPRGNRPQHGQTARQVERNWERTMREADATPMPPTGGWNNDGRGTTRE